MAERAQARIRIALAASVGLHAVLLAGLPGPAIHGDPPMTVLEARLAPTPEPPVPPAPAPSQRKPAPKPPPPKPAAKPAPKAAAAPPPLATTEAPSPLALPAPPPAVAEPGPVAEAAAPEPAQEPPVPEPAPPEPPEAPPVVAPAVPEPPAPAPVRTQRLPRRMAITYDLFMGADRFMIGRTEQAWELQAGRYRLSSRSETTGLAGLFRPYQLGYASEGTVAGDGLRPDTFTVRRGRAGERQLEARFDWAAMSLALGPPGASQRVPLATGALDLIAFVYQLALLDLAPGRLRLPITNGAKLEIYELDVGSTETLDTPLGTLQVLPVRQVRQPGQESMEIWLAPQLRQLPVRIRFFDREGKMSGEQLAREIRIDAE